MSWKERIVKFQDDENVRRRELVRANRKAKRFARGPVANALNKAAQVASRGKRVAELQEPVTEIDPRGLIARTSTTLVLGQIEAGAEDPLVGRDWFRVDVEGSSGVVRVWATDSENDGTRRRALGTDDAVDVETVLDAFADWYTSRPRMYLADAGEEEGDTDED